MFKEIQKTIVEQKPIDTHQVWEKNHGRHSHWTVFVFDASQNSKAKEWKNLKRFIHVHKHTINTKTKKETHNDRLYISSNEQSDAAYYQNGIRGHWRIETSLHWVKDVVHKEDSNAIRVENGPVNSAIFSSIAINIHRTKGAFSVTNSQIKFRANMDQLFDFIRT